MTVMTKAEIEALLDGTTPGPWLWRWKSDSIHRPGEPPYTYGDTVLHPTGSDRGIDVSERDAELLIAAPDLARTALALHQQLADALTRLAAAEAQVGALVDGLKCARAIMDTPIARRRLNLDPSDERLVAFRAAIASAQGVKHD